VAAPSAGQAGDCAEGEARESHTALTGCNERSVDLSSEGFYFPVSFQLLTYYYICSDVFSGQTKQAGNPVDPLSFLFMCSNAYRFTSECFLVPLGSTKGDKAKGAKWSQQEVEALFQECAKHRPLLRYAQTPITVWEQISSSLEKVCTAEQCREKLRNLKATHTKVKAGKAGLKKPWEHTRQMAFLFDDDIDSSEGMVFIWLLCPNFQRLFGNKFLILGFYFSGVIFINEGAQDDDAEAITHATGHPGSPIVKQEVADDEAASAVIDEQGMI